MTIGKAISECSSNVINMLNLGLGTHLNSRSHDCIQIVLYTNDNVIALRETRSVSPV